MSEHPQPPTTVPPWSELGLRVMRPASARTPVVEFSPVMAAMVAAGRAALSEPLRGISTDGTIRRDLATAVAVPRRAAAALDAAQALLALLDDEQRGRLVFPLDADERRLWLNVHPNVMRHGLLLEELTATQRAAAMGLLEVCLSERGYRQARGIMQINGMLSELTGRPDEFGEWPYWLSLFGEPSADAPWAWQIDGHHLNLNVFLLGAQMALTPSFMGSEPCRIDEGPLAGLTLFGPEQHAGVQLMRSLDDGQRAATVRFESIADGSLPPELNHIIDGRMRAGAFKDNAVLPAEGLRGDALSDAQRRLLRELISTYIGWAHDDYHHPRLAEIEPSLDETRLLWMGRVDEDGPFYYRVQGPLVLIEFDHHAGIVFDNVVPSAHHIHTIVRTPHGGDYGVDLLRRHYQQHDHGGGR